MEEKSGGQALSQKPHPREPGRMDIAFSLTRKIAHRWQFPFIIPLFE